jgi:hypothetical protein
MATMLYFYAVTLVNSKIITLLSVLIMGASGYLLMNDADVCSCTTTISHENLAYLNGVIVLLIITMALMPLVPLYGIMGINNVDIGNLIIGVLEFFWSIQTLRLLSELRKCGCIHTDSQMALEGVAYLYLGVLGLMAVSFIIFKVKIGR